MRFIRGLFFVLFLLAAGVVIMWVLGARLPREHTATASELLAATPAKIWDLITDVQSQPSWRTGLKSVERLPSQDGNPCWQETSAMGKMPLCEVKAERARLRVVRIANPNLAFGGTWTYTLSPAPSNQTLITITENGTTGPPIWRFLGHYVYHEDTQIKQYEDALQKAVTK